MARRLFLLFPFLYLCLSISLALPVSQNLNSRDAPACLISAAMGPSPIEEDLRYLTDHIGGRMSGSPSMRRAVAWAKEAFHKAGVDEVHTEKFTMPVAWSEGHTQMEVLAPVSFPVRLVSIAWAPPTPARGIEADVVNIGEGGEDDFKQAGTTAKGNILLVHSPLLKTWDGMFAEYARAPAIIDRAVGSGAAAILWMSSREGGLLYRHEDRVDGLERLPSAVLAREDAQRIARFLIAGQKVRVRFSLPNRVGGPFEEENVIAEIRGREKPDEIVILGAHLDSWAVYESARLGSPVAVERDVSSTLNQEMTN